MVVNRITTMGGRAGGGARSGGGGGAGNASVGSARTMRPEGLSSNKSLESANNMAMGKIKYGSDRLDFLGSQATQHATVNLGGKIEDVGPAVQFNFANKSTGMKSSYTIYGNTESIQKWASAWLK